MITRLAGLRAPQAFWSAAARRRFHTASLLVSYPLGYCLHTGGQRVGRAESGSKLPHSKAGSARTIRNCHTNSLGERVAIPQALESRVRGFFQSRLATSEFGFSEPSQKREERGHLNLGRPPTESRSPLADVEPSLHRLRKNQ